MREVAAAEVGLRESQDRLIARLEDWRESVDPCEHGHVEHGPEAHLGRHLVHSMSGGGSISLGADWDYDDAVAFIRAAVRVEFLERGMAAATGHKGAARSPEGRWIAFATKDESR